ncbi:hypothetical protein DHEL01_v208634 [Diaporthe helianthi]|uniref:Heterokaryon incompatibility domain-containing protein n=1 Tax=Diaporthe helianthi TaxID=158607 RepID=A0A2P5HRZ8_DIAHE|nr:hypothetical protein DHEL01_v208634 [Diaporthe helianthi]
MGIRTRAEAITFESGLGQWPRRLLKVEANLLVSCEWTEGNVYGGIKSPAYAAVSYTWGRFELPHNSGPHIMSLDIRSDDGSPVPWRVPRIDPDTGFKLDAMLTVLHRVTRNQPIQSTSVYHEEATKVALSELQVYSDEQHPQFVWLDIGCIDQRDNSPEKMLEIGRQAAIFRGAAQVYVWLYQHPAPTLGSLLASIYEA